MTRPKTEHGRRVHMNVKFSEAEAAEIDAARGTAERGTWLREAALSAARDRTMPPEVAAASLAADFMDRAGVDGNPMPTLAGGSAFIAEYGGTALAVVVTPQREDGPLMSADVA